MAASSSQCRGQQEPVREPLGHAPRVPGAVLRAERGAGVLHQMAELHAGRARGLAAAALDALVHRAQERVVDRGAALVDRAHRRDAAAR